MSILRIVRSIVLFLNGAALILGVYGWGWRPFFRIGERSSPYWLVRLYSYITPLGAGIVLILLILVLLLGYIGKVVSNDGGKGMFDIAGLLRIGLVIAVIAMIPAFLVTHTHLESEDFNTGNYNLLREESFGQTSLMLVECTDPGQMSCKTVARQDMPLPMPPTPMPTRVVEIEGREVILVPNYVETPVPLVELGIEASTGQLGIRIGDQWQILATPEATPEPNVIEN